MEWEKVFELAKSIVDTINLAIIHASVNWEGMIMLSSIIIIQSIAFFVYVCVTNSSKQ